jgi:pyruvate/2-oxoglutarate dehydrogenase complex dihydrolipoamide acyltransferase (E2) component
LTWVGLPDYLFGAISVCNLEKTGLDYAFMPIPSISNSVVVAALGKKQTVIEKDDETGVIKKKLIQNLNFSIDHRFVDGGYGAKFYEAFKTKVNLVLENMGADEFKNKLDM